MCKKYIRFMPEISKTQSWIQKIFFEYKYYHSFYSSYLVNEMEISSLISTALIERSKYGVSQSFFPKSYILNRRNDDTYVCCRLQHCDDDVNCVCDEGYFEFCKDFWRKWSLPHPTKSTFLQTHTILQNRVTHPVGHNSSRPFV